MKKIRLYKKILKVQFVTGQRGYKAIGGEFLVIPLLYILHKGYKLLEARVIETKEHFKEKEKKEEWSREGIRDYAK